MACKYCSLVPAGLSAWMLSAGYCRGEAIPQYEKHSVDKEMYILRYPNKKDHVLLSLNGDLGVSEARIFCCPMCGRQLGEGICS